MTELESYFQLRHAFKELTTMIQVITKSGADQREIVESLNKVYIKAKEILKK